MFDRDVIMAAKDTLDISRENAVRLVMAESCTGGLVAAALTSVAGSSAVVERGFVTYSNEAKVELLGVDPGLIDTYGAVSEQVARAMAEGALMRSHAQIAVSVTGIAGPGGGSAEKPVGLVHFGCASDDDAPTLHVKMAYGDCGRDEIRRKSVLTALALIRSQFSAASALA